MTPRLRACVLLLSLTTIAALATGFSSRRKHTEETPPSEARKLSSEQSLAVIMKRNIFGLDLESEQYQEWIRERARVFALIQDEKATNEEKQLFQKECENPSSRHPFCEFVSDDAGSEKVASSRARRSHEDRRRVARTKTWIEKGKLAELMNADAGDLREAVRGFRSFKPLENIYRKLASAKECYPTALAFALGSKAEEYLPSQDYQQKSLTLYAAAARCGDDESAIRAKYRLSLIEIWKGRCEAALPHLDSLAGGLGNNDYRSRALYWKAQCAEKAGDTASAAQARETLLAEHPFSLHTIIAHREAITRLGTSLQPDSPVLFRSVTRPELNATLVAAESLMAIREIGRARKLLDSLSTVIEGSEPSFRLYVASLYSRIEDNLGKFRVLAPLFRDHSNLVSRSALELYYPRREVNSGAIQAVGLDELLVLSLIRQESAFNERARSRAGARGLMQIMPATARRIERIPVSALYDPDHNIRIGSKYFSRLLRRYSDDTELALAAYNAGPMKINQWLKRYPMENRLLFLDILPYKETREYVSSIARNYFWYTMLYGTPLPASSSGPARASASEAGPKDVFRIFKTL